jgi:hypothetical protein
LPKWPPVDLRLLARQGRELEERLGPGRRADRADVAPHRRVAADIAPLRTISKIRVARSLGCWSRISPNERFALVGRDARFRWLQERGSGTTRNVMAAADQVKVLIRRSYSDGRGTRFGAVAMQAAARSDDDAFVAGTKA